MPALLRAATICSDSACLTRGSLAPWAISSGMRIASARDSGERDHRKSASFAGSPTRWWNMAIMGAQYGGTDSISVIRLDGPTMSTAQQYRSGVNAAPARAA
jgi:hypothetical protein